MVNKNSITFFNVGGLDPKYGKIYVVTTVKYPPLSIDGMNTVFILHYWTSDAILFTPITNAK